MKRHSGIASAVPSMLLLALGWCPAATASDLTLAAAVHLAQSQAPSLEASRAGVLAAQQDARRAGALPDPMLTVGINNLPITGTDAFDPAADMMTMKTIGLRQEIPATAERNARKTLAARAVDEARAMDETTRVLVAQATAQAWIDAWGTRQVLRVLQQQREQAALVAELAKARLIGNRATASDALAARAGVLELENQILAAQANRESAAAMLVRWTGEESSPADEAPDFARLPVEPATLLASVDRLPTVLPLQARIERAAAAVDVARAGKRPDWSLAAAYGQRSGGRDDMLMLEVGIRLPIFPGNRQDRDVAAREAEYQGALATREDQRRAAAASLRARIAQWRGLLAQVETDEQRLLPLASDRTATALASYRGGGELNSWIEARRDELATRLSHVNHVVELGRTWAELAFLLPKGSQP